MAENKQDTNQKKGFPTTFLLFLLAVILVVVTMQNFMSVKHAKVAFTHQVEHLVNLNLIVPEESKKVALKDNLVTFTGKFRERLTDESKNRFRFLERLEANHKLKAEQEEVGTDLASLRGKIHEAAEWYLGVSGLTLPEGGFRIVDGNYDLPEQQNAIIIRELSPKGIISLRTLRLRLSELGTALAAGENSAKLQEQLTLFEGELATLIGNFQSPILGIGSESMKQELKTIGRDITEAQPASVPFASKIATYERALMQMQLIVDALGTPEKGVRLSELRSVREFKTEMERYALISSELGKNEAQLDKARQSVASAIWYFQNRELSTKTLEKQDPEIFNHWFVNAKQEWDHFKANSGLLFKAPDQPRNLVLERTFKSEEPAPNYFSYILTILPIALVILLLYFVFSKQLKGMGGGAMNFAKSPAKMLQKGHSKITFKDVAGIDEAKEELVEIVEFLKNPAKFTSLGGKIPKGVLCVGPPGTGKTLVAKAVAGEADRPFYCIAGSDFVEMFVGVGASRIRDMFAEAKKNAPCIIFIDEIDAVGRHRGAGIGGGHDEREQTLNQLLVEMDGFDTTEGVILIAATNRPDVLDKALLRPGRFDRRVMINLPDIKGRFEILKVHARKIKIDPTVDLLSIARSTPGASGADLENLLNEAALLAARRGRSAVTTQETSEARDKVLYGKERRSLEIDENEKRTTAFHESGHTIIGLLVEHSDPIDKVTIIPRGFALGATHFLPKKNRLSYWKKEVLDQLAVLMGGRAAEEIFLGDMSSGAQLDITQATRLARSMVCEWGMSELGTVAYDERADNGAGYMSYHEKSYSEETAKEIDIEVRKLLEAAHKRASELIIAHKEQVEVMAKQLVEFETLDSQDIQDILSGDWDEEKKRKRLSDAEELNRVTPVKPPPPPKFSNDDPTENQGEDPGLGIAES